MSDITFNEVKTLLIDELERYKLDYDGVKKRIGILHKGELELSSGAHTQFHISAFSYDGKTILVRAYGYEERGIFSIYPITATFTISPGNIISS